MDKSANLQASEHILQTKRQHHPITHHVVPMLRQKANTSTSSVASVFQVTLLRIRRAFRPAHEGKILLRHELLRETQAQPVCASLGGQFRLVGNTHQLTRYTVTDELPRGAQARMMQAAAFSEHIGHRINTILTINAAHLQRIGEGGIFGVGHLWDGLQNLHELIRKWISARGIFWASIWVREWAPRGYKGQAGEHWHIALHLPKCLHADFAKQVAEWTGEAVGAVSPSARESAVSVGHAWHLGVRHGRGGPENIAAYFGKSEPSTIKLYGRRVENPDKPRNTGVYRFGGYGPIEGKRFHICKTLGATAQAKHAAAL